MVVVGIDPGKNTGFASIDGGKIEHMKTLSVLEAIDLIDCWSFSIDLVVLKDSTLQTHVFSDPGVKTDAAMKIARNDGEIDGYCKLIRQRCIDLQVSIKSVSPKNKGPKIEPVYFKKITGWDGPSNQHERDAVMLAWPYRLGDKN